MPPTNATVITKDTGNKSTRVEQDDDVIDLTTSKQLVDEAAGRRLHNSGSSDGERG